MNVQEKEKQQRFIHLIIGGIDSATNNVVKAKDAYRTKMNELAMGGGATYSQTFLETKIQEERDSFAAKMQNAFADMEKRLNQLRELLNERDAVLDLTNPNLTNALQLIQTIGSGMSFDQAKMINANFVHDQRALTCLYDAYKSFGVTANGNIDSLIYKTDSIINRLIELASDGTVKDGSINFFATEFAKFALLEGQAVESTPDQYAVSEAICRAAGLPVPQELLPNQ